MGAKIEVTQEMAEAGAAILLALFKDAMPFTAPDVAKQIFEAMLSAQDGVDDG